MSCAMCTGAILLYGIPQTAYTVEYNTNMLDAASWKVEWQGTLTNLSQTFETLSITNQTIFYRARE